MSKSLIVYFSLGGTTARVAESIAAGLRAAEYQVDLCNIKDAQPPGPDGYDLLGIGTPAYYFRPPFNVMDYVNSLPNLEGLPAFVFVLHGTYLGDTGNVTRQVLARKGAREVGYFHCRGADFFLGYLKEGYLFSPDHPTAEELTQAEEFGRQVAASMAGQEYTRPQDDPPLAIIYRLERFLVNRWLIRQMYSRLFRVKREQCTACGLCVKGCPTGNITEDQEGRPVWGRSCLLCLNCEMKCPQDVITSPMSWPLFRPIMMYNVRRASRDSTLDHVRVKHSRGRTKRV
jgi:flavodoxin/Pyruvate/2-oxoacid:ferredoxin oxidoreductase delta subunit